MVVCSNTSADEMAWERDVASEPVGWQNRTQQKLQKIVQLVGQSMILESGRLSFYWKQVSSRPKSPA
jgi:hypothetical protein